MGDVHDIRLEREKRDPHVTGKARCLDCRHEWMAVAPQGTTWMECPACSLVRGRFIGQCERGGLHWVCGCGCDLFYLAPAGPYCPNCGVAQECSPGTPLGPVA